VVAVGSPLLASPPVRVKGAPPTGSATVRFSRDLAGVLAEHCAGCHGNDGQIRAQLSVTSFTSLMRGGDSGPAVLPGNAAESLIIQKLKGTAAGQRMPQGSDPLANDLLAKFETWITEGARFDGPDPNQSIAELAAISQALAASHQRLRADRAKLAEGNWQLVMPDDAPQRLETENFLLLGNLDAAQLHEFADLAESLVPRVAKTIRAPADQPLVKGGVTLFVFRSSYDYGEFGRMVEKRELSPAVHAHSRFTTVDAYAALHAGRLEPDDLAASLAQQIARLYVASLGEAPAWFRDGVAQATAARVATRSKLVVRWNDRVGEAFTRMQAPDDFLAGRATAEDATALAYGFAQFLMSDSRRFQKLLGSLVEKGDFATAFGQSYGAAPEQVAGVWAAREASRLSRKKIARQRPGS
jgi:hypothetical protein